MKSMAPMNGARVSVLSSPRLLRTATLPSDPEQVLKAVLHNCRTKKETLMSCVRRCGDLNPRGAGSRGALAQLNRAIQKSESALVELRENEAESRIVPFGPGP